MAIDYDSLARAARQKSNEPKPVNPLATAAVVGGALGAGAVGLRVARNVPSVVSAGLKLLPMTRPIGHAIDAAQAVGRLAPQPAPVPPNGGGSVPPEAAAPATVSTTPAAPKLPASVTTVTAEDIAAHPELKNYQPGETIRRATLEDIKLQPGSVQPRVSGGPTRPISVIKGGKPMPAKAPAPTPESPGAGRGASGPELVRRAEALSAEPAAPPLALVPSGAARHEVQYFSESQGKFIPIEDMPISHLRNAMNQLHAKLSATNHPSPVTQKQFEAIKNEVTYRAKQAGELTVPGPTKAGMKLTPGSVQSRVGNAPAAASVESDLMDQMRTSLEAEAAHGTGSVASRAPTGWQKGMKEALAAKGRLTKLAASAADTPLGKAAGKVLGVLGEADRALAPAGFILPEDTWNKIMDDLNRIYGPPGGRRRPAGPTGA